MCKWRVCLNEDTSFSLKHFFMEIYRYFSWRLAKNFIWRHCMDTFKDFSWRSFSYRISLVQVRSSPYLNKDHIIHRWVVAHDRRGCSSPKRKITWRYMKNFHGEMKFMYGYFTWRHGVCGYFTWIHRYFAWR